MEYRRLGRTDIDVSTVCLGTMTWGQQNTEADGHEQMDYALDQGVNFFDTAELYAIPPQPDTQGSTETIIGTWFAARKNRDKVVLASKACGRNDMMNWFRDSGAGTKLDKANIHEAVNKSLKRLQTDYIDVYQLHWPDRPLNVFGGLEYAHIEGETIPVPEILEVLDGLVKDGKIRHVGLSNESAWGVAKFVQAAEDKNLTRVVSVQNAFNLLNRSFEVGLSEFAHRDQVGLLAYSPLGQGYLTGKYMKGARPAGARTTLYERGQRYETPHAEPAIESYVGLAKAKGIDPAHLALKFCDTRPFVTSTIIGATTMEQLKADIAGFDIPWTEELEKEIQAFHLAQPNPCP
jgi:aryl-alcohol dehydrogenase-like predicted oxidoreductase